MEFYFETSLMRFGLLIGVFAILILILGIYFDLKTRNKDQDVTLKNAIKEGGRHHVTVKIVIFIILLITFGRLVGTIEYYGNLVRVDEFYVKEVTGNNTGTDNIYVEYGSERMKLATSLGSENREIFEDFFVDHLCEIEYEIISKRVRRIKVIE